MNREAFETLVQEGIAAIPEKFRTAIRNVAFLIEDEPSAELRAREGLRDNETLLGYYHGVPNSERGDSYGMNPVLPDTITIFQQPIEAASGGDLERMRSMVIETVWHEVGHHFGLNEQVVRKRERQRFPRGQ